MPRLACVLLGACKTEAGSGELPPSPVSSALEVRAPNRREAAPISSEVVAFEKAVQAKKLSLPARRIHSPQLAFGRGVLGQLGADALRVYDAADFRLLASEPLEGPRALLALADGSLLAIGAQHMLRWEREKKHAASLSRPVLLPGSQVYADAQQSDRFWVFDAGGRAGDGRGPTLFSYLLKPGPAELALPEQSIELVARGGVFGVTREGTWLYVTASQAERFSPGGLRLSGLALSEPVSPTWLLPARRLDQSLWLDDNGHTSRVLVSPTYKRLATVQLPGRILDAAVGGEGTLLAAIVVTGEGPRFELLLLDPELAELGRVVLPSDPPTGNDDWVKVVTENQTLAVALREKRVAVGGPSRLTIFDGLGRQVFSIPSR